MADGHGSGLDVLIAVQQVIVQVVRICLGFHMGHRFVGGQVIVVLGMEVQAQQPTGQESHGNNSQKGTATSHQSSIAGSRPPAPFELCSGRGVGALVIRALNDRRNPRFKVPVELRHNYKNRYVKRCAICRL